MNVKQIYCTNMKNFFHHLEKITVRTLPRLSKLSFEMSLYHELCAK